MKIRSSRFLLQFSYKNFKILKKKTLTSNIRTAMVSDDASGEEFQAKNTDGLRVYVASLFFGNGFSFEIGKTKPC
jgi:hypothetical protein